MIMSFIYLSLFFSPFLRLLHGRSRRRLQITRVFHLFQHDLMHNPQCHFNFAKSARTFTHVWLATIQLHHSVRPLLNVVRNGK